MSCVVLVLAQETLAPKSECGVLSAHVYAARARVETARFIVVCVTFAVQTFVVCVQVICKYAVPSSASNKAAWLLTYRMREREKKRETSEQEGTEDGWPTRVESDRKEGGEVGRERRGMEGEGQTERTGRGGSGERERGGGGLGVLEVKYDVVLQSVLRMLASDDKVYCLGFGVWGLGFRV